MSFPAPPPPEGPRACPKCGCEHLTEDEFDPRFMLLWLVNNTRCNQCGHAFNGKTGKSTTMTLTLVIALPLLVVCALMWFFLVYAPTRK